MATAAEIAKFADDLLSSAEVPDYANALNGLQVDVNREIVGLAAAVDFSSRTVRGTRDTGANLLLVHHGAFWGGLQPLTGARRKLFGLLFDNSIGLYSSHLPLDSHPTLGNNVLLAKELGLSPQSKFGRYKSVSIGVSGHSPTRVSDLLSTTSAFAMRHGGRVHHTPFPADRLVGSWAICTGAGAAADTLREAAETKVETLIVGEGPHWTAVDAEESGLVLVYAGHYATETLGIQALAAALASEFKLPWHFIPSPTGT